MKKETFSVCLPPDIVTWIKQQALEDNRTPSNWLTLQLSRTMQAEQSATDQQ